jgi:hypothetical protein
MHPARKTLHGQNAFVVGHAWWWDFHSKKVQVFLCKRDVPTALAAAPMCVFKRSDFLFERLGISKYYGNPFEAFVAYNLGFPFHGV